MSREPTSRDLGNLFAIAGIGLEMVLPAAAGIYLDIWLDTGHWFTTILAVVGFAGGLIHLLAIVNRQEQDESNDKKPPA